METFMQILHGAIGGVIGTVLCIVAINFQDSRVRIKMARKMAEERGEYV